MAKGDKKSFLKSWWFWVLVVVVVIVLSGWRYYNSFVGLDQNVQTQWSKVESSYQRRFDLIPNVVSTVQGAANFEKETYTAVTEARTKWLGAGSVNEKVEAANATQSALARLLVTVENYPDLKATAAFQDLINELSGTENRINVERNRYNDEVKVFNTATKKFPAMIFAKTFGFDGYKFFEAAEGSDKAPEVKF